MPIKAKVGKLKTISIEFPDEIAELFEEKDIENSLKKLAILQLVREGKISSGKAAEILKMTRWDFMDLMSLYDIPNANFSEEELDRQMKEKTVTVTSITEQERLARIDAVMGMFAHLPGSVEDFIKEKQKDLEIENRRWKE
jgi:predicted HTH domain antitoxin